MPATVLIPLKYFGVSIPATMASTSLSTLRNAHLGGHRLLDALLRGAVQLSQGVPMSSATGPRASVTPVEIPAQHHLHLLLEDELP